jgi:hypothetical protein
MKAKDLARLCSQLRQFKGLDVTVEYRRGQTTLTISDVGPSANQKGRPTTRVIRGRQSGREKYWDGNYEFEVTALLVAGERWPVPDPATE